MRVRVPLFSLSLAFYTLRLLIYVWRPSQIISLRAFPPQILDLGNAIKEIKGIKSLRNFNTDYII